MPPPAGATWVNAGRLLATNRRRSLGDFLEGAVGLPESGMSDLGAVCHRSEFLFKECARLISTLERYLIAASGGPHNCVFQVTLPAAGDTRQLL